MRSLKWLVPLAIVVGLVSLAFMPKAIEVDLGTVGQGAMTVTIDDDGETRVRDRYTISTPLTGQLQRISLNPGDIINKGDVLAIINPVAPGLLDPRARRQAVAQVNAAKAGIDSATTQWEARKMEAAQLEKSYLRNQSLHNNGSVSDATYEQIESAYLAAKHAREAARSAVAIAEFELKLAEAALLHFDETNNNDDDATFIIHSPVDGQVLRVHEKSSRSLQPGIPLLEIGNPRELEIRIDVLSQDAVSILPGQQIIIRHWGGTPALHGRVRLVEPSAFTKVSALGVDEQRVNVIADFEKPDTIPDSIGDGYRVEAGIIIWESKDALKLPAGALFRHGKNWAVYKIEGRRARLTTVEIGRNNGDSAEVLTGLDAGDQVILHPSDRIEDGTLIKPRS